MTVPPELNATRLRVLRILFHADEPLWALDVARGIGMTYGTVYHSFRVLYDLGWAVGITKPLPGAGHPPRVLYRLTAEGRRQAADLLDEGER